MNSSTQSKLSKWQLCVAGIVAVSVGLAMWNMAAPSALKSDEEIILYPAIAKRSPGGWRAEIQGVIYEPEQRAMMVPLIRKVTGLDESELTPSEAAVFRERCRLFLIDHEREKKLTTIIEGRTVALGTSAADGGFRGKAEWGTNLIASASNGIVSLSLPINGLAGRKFPIELHLLDETGLSVISDIDDTIKISEVLDQQALLRNTFCRPFKPVAGMAGVYRQWAETEGARFHYVTASPWQLYLALSDFTRSHGFPAGSFHMKSFRVKDRTVLSVFASPEQYKPGVIEPLFREFPRRQFVLVGDSGEKDPEIYGGIARKFPTQVRCILIRDVTGEESTAARYRKAFADLPPSQWQIFKEPGEIRDALETTGSAEKPKAD